MIVVNPHRIEYHYKIFCPYCSRTEKFLLNPLEVMGVIKVERINIGLMYTGPPVAKNLRITSATGSRFGTISAPILYCGCGHYFFPVSKDPSSPPRTAVAEMARSLINHLCQVVKIYDQGMRGERFLEGSDLLRNPLINRGVQGV